MDAIVVDTEKTGRDCIQYMKEQVFFSILSKPVTVQSAGLVLFFLWYFWQKYGVN
jgi:hypothetical protein